MTEPAAGTRHSFRTQVDGPRFWHPRGFKTAEILADVSKNADIPMAKLAIAWPLKRRFVASVIIGVKTAAQLAANMELGDWDVPDDIWQTLDEKTRPEEDYLTFFNRLNYKRHFAAAEFYDGAVELP